MRRVYHAARRGLRVLGVDRFAPPHDRGSSHGQTRLIRQAYYEHPDYVPLVQRAFALWHELESNSGQSLYNQVGLLQIGPADGDVLCGVRASAQTHHLPIEEISPREARQRFAGFRVPDTYQAIFEQRAGYLWVERAVAAHVEAAQRAGAELHAGETVESWQADGDGVRVRTDRASYSAARLIITAGPWAGTLLGDLGIALEVRRKPLYWWRTRADTYRDDRGSPGFLYDLPQGCFYGFPQVDERGIKAAEHTGGSAVGDPLTVDRAAGVEQSRVAAFVEEYLPDATATCTDYSVCMYTMTPDAHFIVDRHPHHPQVAFAAGLSGHGFKFTCVLGEILVELALDGRTAQPIEFLSLARPGLRRQG